MNEFNSKFIVYPLTKVTITKSDNRHTDESIELDEQDKCLLYALESQENSIYIVVVEKDGKKENFEFETAQETKNSNKGKGRGNKRARGSTQNIITFEKKIQITDDMYYSVKITGNKGDAMY
ncbi:hypothetical protein M9Y10_013101 [Tritrichomonas musculus]|uniref:Uncharacterized protein n=1 Tax=Tritrichomonas musculus TaxID=1915356 RepID=A0ABR2I6Z7_9EUKA